jgi:hypothetical protein
MKPGQSNINQSTQKRENTKNNKRKDPCPKRTTEEGEPQGEHQVPKPPSSSQILSSHEEAYIK